MPAVHIVNRCTALLTVLTALLILTGEVPGQAMGKQATVDFTKWDTDQDGSLSRDELPASHRPKFDDADTDADDKLSKNELFLHYRDKDRMLAAQKSFPAGVKVIQDLAYIDNGHIRQKLDLFVPAAASTDTPVPLVVWIHGGGWKKGNKSGLSGQEILLQHGFALASINYRLVADAAFPAQIQDCKSAIRFLRTHADQYGYDPDRIGIWGGSAGGHLVSLLGTTANNRQLESDSDDQGISVGVKAVCDYFGPSDLMAMLLPTDPNNADEVKRSLRARTSLTNLLGGPPEEKAELLDLASPANHISPDDPPFLIFHGDSDPIVPLNQSTVFHEKLVAAGIDAKLVVVPDAGHAFFNSDDQLATVVRFFERTLK